MKRLHIQLQPTRSPELDLSEAIARLTHLAAAVHVTEGEDDGRYINVDFKAADLSGLWANIQEIVESLPGLARAVIIVCEGERGWDDYLLLHHFNPQEELDQLA